MKLELNENELNYLFNVIEQNYSEIDYICSPSIKEDKKYKKMVINIYNNLTKLKNKTK
tara:strand:+ start:2849 stop:3022 length:174 start_codon:yes stop_codon:yes gene_type:complete